MYFDIEPKMRREDLFGVDYQLELFKKYLLDRSVRMIVLKGLRRTGKTSLLNVALGEVPIKSVKIDVREAPFYDRREFVIFTIKKVREKMIKILDKIIERIVGVKVGYEKFSFELIFSKEENVTRFFDELNRQLGRDKQILILAFDEAQLLKRIKFDYFLASIFDNYKNIKLVLTGSEVGLLDKLLGKADYEAPLYGRAYLEIELKKLKEQEAEQFLKAGFAQLGKKISFWEVREVIEELDGVVGWLTYYGWFRSIGFSHRRALGRVKEEGKALLEKEWDTFLGNRKARVKYARMIRYLAKGYNSWSLLKQAFRKEGIRVSDTQLNLLLRELVAYGFVEKIGEKYFSADPLLYLVKV